MATPHKLSEVKETSIGNIHPSTDNPRRITPRAVEITAASIERFGWQQPIVVDTNGTILAGHTRYKAAEHLKLKTVPVVVAEHLTPEEAKAYRIADNRTGDYTTWDYPELVNQLEDLEVEFANELGVDDWRGIIEEFTAPDTDDGDTDDDEDLTAIVFDDEADTQVVRSEYGLTVICASEEARDIIQAELIKRREVVDVAYKR